MKRANTNTRVVPLVLSAPLGQVINPGWLGLAQTALLLGDKGNPAIIFSEQGILISTLPGGRKPKSSAKGFFFRAALPSLQTSNVLALTGIKPSLTMVGGNRIADGEGRG